MKTTIELIRSVRSPAHLKGKVGDVKEVRPQDAETLINGRFAKEVTKKKERQRKNDDETTKPTRNN